jgi:ABC-type multidrug transport system fused ATPase/permease subunit
MRRYFEMARKFGLGPGTMLAQLALNLAGVVFETVGVTIFLPIFQFIQKDGDIQALAATSGLWQHALEFYSFLGIPISLPVLLGTAFLSFLISQAFTFARLVYTSAVLERVVRDVRRSAFAQYLRATTGYQDRMPLGDLANMLTTEARQAVIGLTLPLSVAGYVLLTLCYLVVLIGISAVMTGVALVIIASSAWTLRNLMRLSADSGREVVLANTRTTTFLLERLRSPRLVRLSGTEEAERREMDRLTEQQRAVALRVSTLKAVTQTAIEPIIVGLSCLFLYFAVTDINMTIEEVGFYLVIALRLMPVVKAIVSERQTYLTVRGSIEKVVSRIAEMVEARENPGGSATFTGLNDRIQIEGLWYEYPGGQGPVLKGLDLTIHAGRLTALVGPSGAGKSTLVDMLPRLRQPTAGQIYFDDTPITHFSTESLRRGIGYVPQRPQIFNGTIAEHIAYGRPGAQLEEIREAARLAGADEFIRALPEQYDTPIGEDGYRLSGGQRQRLDLARALLRNAPILMLDEPTSNLDAESEAAFRDALMSIRRATAVTIIVVAHRLSTIIDADQIVVMRDGAVAAVGTHLELVRQGGWYAEALRTQSVDGELRAPATSQRVAR